jgi:hypothetical protein
MQVLFMDNQGRLSIHDRVHCPARLAGLARHFVRTGTDSHGFVYYEEEPWLVRSLGIAYENLQRLTA